ncbi:alanine--tRNA ligase [Amphibiibacter pelophylacis]|uniref:Alanine--tRNA ligase n=1 Tax=Amphibiibacter pelophylacis TaxID=1799477 RepID=A0ACC6P3G6_9BURK
MKAADIRSTFLNFFAQRGHQIVASSPVIPGDDPTLLFTNAGMNQFKDVFLGFDKRPYSRATTSQKCIRAGGKHNDLENVGYTARHHTFFEMLGNFSFGDYFKRDAITFAWELLTVHFGLPKEKLWATVYAEDDEAYGIWKDVIGVPPERIVRIGDNKGGRYLSDNFWMMGDTGPCGPCSEIFYDHGPDVAGGPPGSPDEDGDRYIEIWNNVFMQYNRDASGTLHPLPKPSVDTGMGLERIAAVLQHVHSNYEIDLFQNLLRAAQTAVQQAGGALPDMDQPSLKVIADHIRACSFIVADGVIPGNAGRGYVLRRIVRRAIRHGYKLGARQPFFHTLVDALAQEMGQAYPELVQQRQRIRDILGQEEERFFQTLDKGIELLDGALAQVQPGQALDGELAFRLHDTYGFPLDLTADVCRERGLTVDEAAFDAAMARQREQARAAGKFKMAQGLSFDGAPTTFHGYTALEREGCRVLGLFVDGAAVTEAQPGDDVVVVLDHTPFYAESGGQVGDSGELRSASVRVTVDDTLKIKSDVWGHHGQLVEGPLRVGDVLIARVDAAQRARTMRHHSATHLMHKALRDVLGDHVQQKGSLVSPERTRFDFVHNAPVTAQQIRQIETLVNAQIIANAATQVREMAIEDAQKSGAMMLFGEKYGDSVRVLDIGDSRELCGGTHVARTGDIGFFTIVAESGVAAGVRRVEAVTGDLALAQVQATQQHLDEAAQLMRSTPSELGERLRASQEQFRALEKELAQLKSRLALSQMDSLLAQARAVGAARVLVAQVDGVDAATLKSMAAQLRDRLAGADTGAAVLLASTDAGKVQLAAGVSSALQGQIKAGELASHTAGLLGGKGGGKPDLAMAAGNDVAALPQVLAGLPAWLGQRCG